MSLTIVVGGQYGSEGKGKLVSHLAAKGRDVVAARCGGPNAGHTSHGADGHALLRQLPAAATSPGTRLLLCAGMQVDAELLLDEIDRLSIDPSRVGVDRRAVLVGEDDRRRERDERLGPWIGSTETGTGAALTRKAMRGPDVALAQDDPRLADMVCDVAVELNDAVDRGATVIVEGTQEPACRCITARIRTLPPGTQPRPAFWRRRGCRRCSSTRSSWCCGRSRSGWRGRRGRCRASCHGRRSPPAQDSRVPSKSTRRSRAA